MRKILMAAMALVAIVNTAHAQNTTGFTVTQSDPTGNPCGSNSVALQTPAGKIYPCQNGAYAAASGGSAGPTGATGQQGPTGPQGVTGLTGATGGAGPAGATGATGAIGATGTTNALALVNVASHTVAQADNQTTYNVTGTTATTLVLPANASITGPFAAVFKNCTSQSLTVNATTNGAVFTANGTTYSSNITVPAGSSSTGCPEVWIGVDTTTGDFSISPVYAGLGAAGATGPTGSGGGGGGYTIAAPFLWTPFGSDIATSGPAAPSIGVANQITCAVASLANATSSWPKSIGTFWNVATGYNSWGLLNLSSGSFIANTVTSASGPGEVALALALSSPPSLTAGAYGVCYSGTATADKMFASGTGSGGYFGSIANLDTTNGPYLFTCQNKTSGTSALSWPTTCGTKTAISGWGASPPPYVVMY